MGGGAAGSSLLLSGFFCDWVCAEGIGGGASSSGGGGTTLGPATATSPAVTALAGLGGSFNRGEGIASSSRPVTPEATAAGSGGADLVPTFDAACGESFANVEGGAATSRYVTGLAGRRGMVFGRQPSRSRQP